MPKTAPRFGFRWARLVTRLRMPIVAVGIIGLGVLALPTQDMRLALPDGASAAAGTNQRVAYDLAAAAFGPGSNGPLVVVVKSDDPAKTGALVEQVLGEDQGTEGRCRGSARAGQHGRYDAVGEGDPDRRAGE